MDPGVAHQIVTNPSGKGTTPPAGTKAPDKGTPTPGTRKGTPTTKPSPTPCAQTYNGTHLVCRTPSTSPTSAPTAQPHCHKALNGTLICDKEAHTDESCIPGVNADIGGCKNDTKEPFSTCYPTFNGSGYECQKNLFTQMLTRLRTRTRICRWASMTTSTSALVTAVLMFPRSLSR